MRKFGLQHILFLSLALISVVPAGLLGLMVQKTEFQQEISGTTEKHLLLAKNLIHALSRYVEDVEAAHNFMTINFLNDREIDGLSHLLKFLHFRHFSIVDREGNLRVSVSEADKSDIQKIPAEVMSKLRRYLRTSGADPAQPMFTNVMKDWNGLPSIFVIRTIDENLLALGVLGTEYIVHLQRSITFGKAGHAAIVDKNGRVIGHPRREWRESMRDLSSVEPVRRMMSGESGVVQFYSPAKQAEMIAGYSIVPKTGWGVMVPQPIDELEERSQANRISQIAAILLALVAATILSWWLARVLLTPIRNLVGVATGFRTGKAFSVSQAMPRDFPREVNELTSSFDYLTTELKDRDAALGGSEARFQSLVEGSIQGIIIHRQLKPLFFNRAWAEIHGYTWEQAKAVESKLDWTAPHERERVKQYGASRLRGEPVANEYEYQGLRRDGSFVWLKNMVRLIDWEGEPAFLSTVVDISALKKMEDALRESEARYRLLVELSPDAILIQQRGELVYANPAARNLFAADSAQDLIGQSPTLLVHPDYREQLAERLEELRTLQENLSVTEYKIVRLDGVVIDVEAVSGPTFYMGESAFHSVLRDITERKNSEEALLESEKRFRDFADTAADWFWEMGPDLQFTYMSERVESVVGVPAEFHIGKTREELAGQSTDDEHWQQHLRDLRQRRSFRNFTFLRKGHDGRLQYVSTSGKPMFDDNGRFLGYRGSARDVTASAEAERSRTEFISTISHELRTPLTSIFGALGLIRGGAAGTLPHKLRRMLDIAYNNSDRLVRLINDILDIEKFEAGKMELDLRPIEIMALIEESVEASKGFADDRSVELVLTHVLPGVKVHGDYDRLMQVLANLLSNAVKFSPRGDGVEIWVTRQEGSLRVGISDNGPGIPEQFRDRIFEKYSQADTSDSRRAGGTGLGLSISKAIVEKHGGEIGVDTETASGTTLFFTLPELCEREVDQ